MQYDTSLYFLGRIANATEKQAKAAADTRREVIKVRRKVEDLVTWVKRGALLAALWGTGLGLHLNAEQTIEIIVALLKARL